MVKRKQLFDQFPPVSTREWMDKITADLKGADFNRRLVWKTNEGFDVMPFYRKENLKDLKYSGSLVALRQDQGAEVQNAEADNRKINNSWRIRQDIRVSDYGPANRKAREIILKGADSLGFTIEDTESVNEKNFGLLLGDLAQDKIEINFLSNGKAREILSCLIKSTEVNGFEISVPEGCIETDPIGRLMVNGTLCIPVDKGFDYLAALAREALILPGYRIVQVNGINFSNAGADAVKELAFSISMGVEYLAQLISRGLDAGQAASKIRFSFGTGSNYFMEIAKLRAARILWSFVRDGYNPDNPGSFRMEIHCSTSKWNTTLYDPYVNMLRTQTEAMSSVLGGTDSLTVNPFDIAYGQPGDFSERIARNQQLILREEAYFDKVADPAAGSYYIENLTSLVADHAWKLFLDLEEQGGFLKCVKKGIIREKIMETAEKRLKDTATRKEILLGTNIYPDPDEKISREITGNIRLSEPVPASDLAIEPLVLFRASEKYENLRTRVENASERPVVFLLPIGDKAMRRARSQFSTGFFGCAGYRIIENDGFDTIAEGVNSALESGSSIVVICSSDDEYLQYAPEIHRMIGEKAITVIAGSPDNIDRLKNLGLDHYISIRSDVVETLDHFNSLLGIH